jgi:hypothetical protein
MCNDKIDAQKRQSFLIVPWVLTQASCCWNQHKVTSSHTTKWYTQNERLKLIQRTIEDPNKLF